jgi:hypothetical protein
VNFSHIPKFGILGCETYVAEDPLVECLVRIAWGMHVEASLIDSVGDVEARKGEALKCSDNAVVEGVISSRCAIAR